MHRTRRPREVAYVIARTAGQRPSVQHALRPGTTDTTGCGRDMSDWSRHYMSEAIEEVFCRARGCVTLHLEATTRTKVAPVVDLGTARRARNAA